MPLPIEDYALIGDRHTGALVGVDGSIDWLCMPRFDSASMFGALLGDEEHGHWRVGPVGVERCASRAYAGDSFTLVTRWETPTGAAEVVDFMPAANRRADVIRRIRGISGTVRMEEVLRIRFDYADAIPWVRQSRSERGEHPHEHALIAVAGPDSVVVRGPRLEPDGFAHRTEFDVVAGETCDLVLTWFPAHRPPPPMPDVDALLAETNAKWERWARRTETNGPYAAAVRRSLLVLRALTHEDTNGIVAAATTSLPETFGGDRNWDYRYVWLRDASLTLQALMLHGFATEAADWRDWLLRAIAGDPGDVQIMYGIAGERRLPEWEVTSLPGYRGSAPVRAGNGAYTQFQGDVFGEIMLALEQARQLGVGEDRVSWPLQVALLRYVEDNLERDDHGIWEIRGIPRRFTQSRAMLWAAFDCGIRGVREHGLTGPVEHWERIRDELRHEIDTHGFDDELNSYVQYYGGHEVDASLLTLAQIGFIAPDDPRMLGTVAKIEQDLLRDGLLLRYRTESGVDGLDGDEHPFLACSFWLVEQYALSGRLDDAHRLMARLVGFANDVGLLSEEYDVEDARHVGNTPQAFSHLTLVRAADAIARATTHQDAGPSRLEEPDAD
jgi:Glucoamylase and related glycosyl hydrolases